jgi:hypothetical protein
VYGFFDVLGSFLVTFVIASPVLLLLESAEGGITLYFEVSYKRFYFFVSFIFLN